MLKYSTEKSVCCFPAAITFYKIRVRKEGRSEENSSPRLARDSVVCLSSLEKHFSKVCLRVCTPTYVGLRTASPEIIYFLTSPFSLTTRNIVTNSPVKRKLELHQPHPLLSIVKCSPRVIYLKSKTALYFFQAGVGTGEEGSEELKDGGSEEQRASADRGNRRRRLRCPSAHAERDLGPTGTRGHHNQSRRDGGQGEEREQRRLDPDVDTSAPAAGTPGSDPARAEELGRGRGEGGPAGR